MKILCPRCGYVVREDEKDAPRYEEICRIVREIAESGEEISSTTLKRKVGIMSRNGAQAYLRRMKRDGLLVLKGREGKGARIIYQLTA